jgi:hypothetical protein
MRGKDPNKASPRRKGHRDTGRKPVAIVVDVGDHHRANASVAWARSDLGSLDIKANKAGIARAEPILDVAAEDLSVCSSTGGPGQAALIDGGGGLPITNPKADHRARMSQLLHPVPMSLGRRFLRHSVRFPVKFTDGDRCAALDAGGMTCGDAGGEARA